MYTRKVRKSRPITLRYKTHTGSQAEAGSAIAGPVRMAFL